jgi:hypothetical protein
MIGEPPVIRSIFCHFNCELLAASVYLVLAFAPVPKTRDEMNEMRCALVHAGKRGSLFGRRRTRAANILWNLGVEFDKVTASAVKARHEYFAKAEQLADE